MLGLPKVRGQIMADEEPKFGEDKNKEDVELMKLIDKYDLKMLDYLRKLYVHLGGEYLDIASIKDLVETISKLNKKKTYKYLENLLYPEKCRGVKIPSPIPVPSCSFQLHNCVTLSTNSSGNLAFIFNPFCLFNNNVKDIVYNNGIQDFKVNYLTTLSLNNHSSLSGNSLNPNFRPINIGQLIPSVYEQYRLVSASIIVKYIGRLDIVSGVIGGAIMFDDSRLIQGELLNNDGSTNIFLESDCYSKYGNFDLAMDSFYHQENLSLEGIRMLYFPVDNSYEEYVKLMDKGVAEIQEHANPYGPIRCVSDEDHYKNGFKFFCYTLGAPSSSACFKLDVYCNFESLPNAEFLNYMPVTSNPDVISSALKKESISILQEKPIMRLNEQNSLMTKTEESSIWQTWMNKFKGKIPGLLKLAKAGIMKNIPLLKTGLSIAGALFNGTEDAMEDI